MLFVTEASMSRGGAALVTWEPELLGAFYQVVESLRLEWRPAWEGVVLDYVNPVAAR